MALPFGQLRKQFADLGVSQVGMDYLEALQPMMPCLVADLPEVWADIEVSA